MSGLEIAGAVLLILASALLSIIIVIQDSKSDGMGAVMGSSGGSSYFGKNRGRTLDAILNRWTKIIAIAFFVAVVAVNVGIMFLK